MTKRILVIDDDESIRKAFALALEDTGYSVNTVESGERGLEQARGTSYDLYFLDLKMPGMDGVQTLHELRDIGVKAPIYVVTAFHEEYFEQLKNAERDGVDFELLHKPVTADQIVLVARSALEGPIGHQ
ncbi:MAG: response regulator [Dehalococcoidia bacterium]